MPKTKALPAAPAIPRPNEYYISVGWSPHEKFLPVEGEPVSIPGYEDADFFVHQHVTPYGVRVAGAWRVTEGKTGMMIAGAKGRNAAVTAARERMAKTERKFFDETIAGRLAARGDKVIPRYQPQEGEVNADD